MKLDHLNLDQLKLSPLNVRKKGGKDITDLLPLVRQHGIIQPLLVRPNCEGFEIIAGQRRYHTLVALKEEGIAEPVPCIIMEEGDDTKAIEASLIENLAHLPMDEIDQYKAFAALAEKGMDAGEIAAHFGVTERLVQQRLAIANLIEPVLNAYRREEIDAGTLRILTLATPRRQKAWWKLFRSEDEYAPRGRALKQWLFGGSQVPVGNALFDIAEYEGAIASDLFGEDRYFTDSEAFWALQSTAIAAKREAYLASGWAEVVILDVGQQWLSWDHQKIAKGKGGKVYIACTHDGEVTCHEGYLTHKEARRREKTDAVDGPESTKVERPELTKPMQNYLGLHRHAAVRVELLSHPRIPLRLAVAHIIAGSSLWSVKADEQRAETPDIEASLSAAKATSVFAEEREAIRMLIGGDDHHDRNDEQDDHADDDGADADDVGDDDDADHGAADAADRAADGADHDRDHRAAGTLVPTRYGFGLRADLASLFGALLQMEDETVMRILAFVMAETLAAHSGAVDALGTLFATDMRGWWSPDQTFFDLLRDKQAINAMVREVAGDGPADAHLASTAKVQKKIIADCLDGNRESVLEDWLPRYMEFPARNYSNRATD